MPATRGPATFEMTIAYVLRKPLDFAPGTKYAYSNFACGLLGKIVEQVSGQTYEAFAREQIFMGGSV